LEGKPVARSENLATEEIDGGVLVYDLTADRAHWLDESATAVWRLADGEHSVPEIALGCALSETVVEETVSRLAALELVDPGVEEVGVTRRLAIHRIAAVSGAVAFAGPLISSIVAPTVAMANTATCDAMICDKNSDCAGKPGCKSTSTCSDQTGHGNGGHCIF
jgi:hypothetical protein